MQYKLHHFHYTRFLPLTHPLCLTRTLNRFQRIFLKHRRNFRCITSRQHQRLFYGLHTSRLPYCHLCYMSIKERSVTYYSTLSSISSVIFQLNTSPLLVFHCQCFCSVFLRIISPKVMKARKLDQCSWHTHHSFGMVTTSKHVGFQALYYFLQRMQTR